MRFPGAKGVVALAAALVVFAGCSGGPRMFVNGQADMTFYKKVMILPFGNLSPDMYAGERVTRAFTTEMIIADRFQIVDPWELRAALEQVGGEPNSAGNYSPEKIKDAAAKLGANGVIRGAVTEFQMVRSGSDELPSMAFDVEMLDATTSSVVWRASVSRRAHARFLVFGGGGGRTFSRLVQDACQEAVHELEKHAF